MKISRLSKLFCGYLQCFTPDDSGEGESGVSEEILKTSTSLSSQSVASDHLVTEKVPWLFEDLPLPAQRNIMNSLLRDNFVQLAAASKQQLNLALHLMFPERLYPDPHPGEPSVADQIRSHCGDSGYKEYVCATSAKYLRGEKLDFMKSPFQRELDLWPKRSSLNYAHLSSPKCVSALDEMCRIRKERQLVIHSVSLFILVIDQNEFDQLSFKHCDLDINLSHVDAWIRVVENWAIPNMKSLTLMRGEGIIPVLKANTHLERLVINILSRDNNEQNAILKEISNLNNLRELSLKVAYTGNQLGACLAQLSQLQSLKLELFCETWTLQDISLWTGGRNFKTLEKLVLSNAVLPQESAQNLFTSLVSHTKLQVLELEWLSTPGYDYGGFNQILMNNGDLKVLAFWSSYISDEAFSNIFTDLPELPNLKHLIVHGGGMSNIGGGMTYTGLAWLLKLEGKVQLKEISLRNAIITDIDLLKTFIAANPSLEILNLSECFFDEHQTRVLIAEGFSSKNIRLMSVSNHHGGTINMNDLWNIVETTPGVIIKKFDQSVQFSSLRLDNVVFDLYLTDPGNSRPFQLFASVRKGSFKTRQFRKYRKLSQIRQ